MPWAIQMRGLHPDLVAGIVRHLERFGAIDHTKRTRLAEATRAARSLVHRGLPNHPRTLLAYLGGQLRNNGERERARRRFEKERNLSDEESTSRERERAEDRYLVAASERVRKRFPEGQP